MLTCLFVTGAGGFAAFYTRYPHLCVGNVTTTVGDHATTGSCGQSGVEQLVTPSDSVLIGHFNDQVTRCAL